MVNVAEPMLSLTVTPECQKDTPWYWQGWVRAITPQEGASVVVDLSGNVPAGATVWGAYCAGWPVEKLKALMAAKVAVVFVDFFLDEVGVSLPPECVAYLVERGVFLPPSVYMPVVAPKGGMKLVLLSDGPVRILSPKNPPAINTDRSAPTYPQFEISKAPFEKLFSAHVSVTGAESLAALLSASTWVLDCRSAQVEQALYQVATQHNIKVSYWERATSSPLRILTGYEFAFAAQDDVSLRGRLAHIKNVRQGTLPRTVLEGQTLEQVRLSYPLKRFWNATASGYPLGAATAVVWAGWQKELLSNGRAGRSAAMALLRNSSSETAAWGLALQTLLMDAVLEAPEYYATRLWSALYNRWPQKTLEVSYQLAQKFETYECHLAKLVTIVVETFYKTGRKLEKAEVLLNAFKQGALRWMEDVKPARLATFARLNILMGGQPGNLLASYGALEATAGADTWWAIYNLRQGKPLDTALRCLKADTAAGATQPIADILQSLMIANCAEAFEFYYGLAVKQQGATLSTYQALEALWINLLNPQWGRDRKALMDCMARALEAEKNEGKGDGRAWAFVQVIQGRVAQAMDYWRGHPQKAGAFRIYFANALYLNGLNAQAQEVLAIPAEPLANVAEAYYQLGVAAALGMEALANETLASLQKLQGELAGSPYDDLLPTKVGTLGMLARAANDKEIEALCVQQLEGEVNSVMLRFIASVEPKGLEIEPTLRAWLYKSLTTHFL